MELTEHGEQLIEELDLVLALRSVPDSQRGWAEQKISVRCQSCQAISVFEPARVGQRCDFCGSSSLVEHEEAKEAFRPASLLPMQLKESQVREKVRAWYGSHFWAPSRLKTKAMTDQVHGLYIPYWTFDARVHSLWKAESGDYYYVTESYRDPQGNQQTRQVQKIRWYPTNGHLSCFFDDELVAASKGVDAALLKEIEPFPTERLEAYRASFLSGWVVERYQIDLVQAAQTSRREMERQVEKLCAAQVPGDTHRSLYVQSTFSEQTFKHILVPIWILSYAYGAKKYQVVVNGYTGKIAGKYPLSWIKISLTVFSVSAALLLWLWFWHR